MFFKRHYGSSKLNISAGIQIFEDLSDDIRDNDEDKFMDDLAFYGEKLEKWTICEDFDFSVPQKLYCALLTGLAHSIALKETPGKDLIEMCGILIMGIFKSFVLSSDFREFSAQLIKCSRMYSGNPSSSDKLYKHGSRENADYGSEGYYEFVYLWLTGKDMDYTPFEKFQDVLPK
ncbi:MAG: hypothetical protein K6G03_06040 [Lachnospiraceae bacterium]|nr:hypothetical protein [Lachnospiraceae bacterium]